MKRERIITTAAVITLVPIAYFLSLGPVWCVMSHGGSWKGGDGIRLVREIYRPAILLTNHSEMYFNYYEWCNSWHPQFNKPGFEYLRERDHRRISP